MGYPDSYVYLFHAVGTNLYKIGQTSRDPKTRLQEIQTSCPHELEVVHSVAVEESSYLEDSLHEKWDEVRRSGEWFEVTRDAGVRSIINEMDSFSCWEDWRNVELKLFALSEGAITEKRQIRAQAALDIISGCISRKEYIGVKELLGSPLISDRVKKRIQAWLQSSASKTPF